MRVVKWGCFIFKINLTMEVIENFFSLGYNKLEVNKDLMRLMRLPALPKVKEALKKEITPITPLLVKELKRNVRKWVSQIPIINYLHRIFSLPILDILN